MTRRIFIKNNAVINYQLTMVERFFGIPIQYLFQPILFQAAQVGIHFICISDFVSQIDKHLI